MTGRDTNLDKITEILSRARKFSSLNKTFSQLEVVNIVFYIHQTSGACAGVCVCDCLQKVEKTAAL